MTETPQNTQPTILTAIDFGDPDRAVTIARVSGDGVITLQSGDAIGVDMPPAPMVARWKASVAQFISATQQAMDDASETYRRFGRQVHRGAHQMTQLATTLAGKPRLRRRSRLILVRCPVCHPTANPRPLPHGLGTAYAARRRHR